MVASDEVDESYLKKGADAGDPEACNRLGEYFLGKASETTLSFTPEDELGIDVQIKDLERQKEFFNLKANEAFDYHPSGFTDDWEEGVRYWDNRRGECIDKIKELEEKKQCYEQERIEVDSTRDAYLKRSFEYFEKSALLRDPEGMWNTGWRYWQGEGTPKKDENSAVTWWKQAAERGHKLAIQKLSEMGIPFIMEKIDRPTVFLSYSRIDNEKVERLYLDLRKMNISVWKDTQELLPGEKWKHKIKRALREHDFVIICLSKAALARKGYFQAEIREAGELQKLYPDIDVYIIPVRFDSCEIPIDLEDIQYTDLFPVWEEGVAKIVSTIKKYSQ